VLIDGIEAVAPERSGKEPKPALLMLVPHEPTVDPRVHYTANTLAKLFDVRVLAVRRSFEQRPSDNLTTSPQYGVTTLDYDNAWDFRAAFEFLRLGLQEPQGDAARRRRSNRGLFAFAALGVAALQVVLLPAVALLGITWKVGRHIRPHLPFEKTLLRPVRWAFDAMRGFVVTHDTLRFSLRCSGLMWRHASRHSVAPALIYCHDLYALQAGVMLGQRWGSKVVYDSHEYYPYLYDLKLYRWATEFYERTLVGGVDVYITVSVPLAQALEKLYGVDPVHAIPNVEPRPDAPWRPLRSEMAALAAGRLKILFQGSFAPGRGLDELIDEWAAVDQSKAALFLRGPRSPALGVLETKAAAAGFLERSIFVLSPVLERDLIPAAAEADVGLVSYTGELPSYRFACPNKVSQYLHAGLPLIANNIPVVERLIREHSVGIVYDLSVKGTFAEAVNALAADPARVARLQARARVVAQEEYCWELYEPALLALVEEQAAKHRDAVAPGGVRVEQRPAATGHAGR
jgi:glycosyltransferase involved in cell wall biosynthesis